MELDSHTGISLAKNATECRFSQSEGSALVSVPRECSQSMVAILGGER